MQKRFSTLVLIGVIIMVGLGGAYYFGKLPIKPNEPKLCTQEAKQCPDGSYVGRTSPNCEFAPCPSPVPQASEDEPVTELPQAVEFAKEDLVKTLGVSRSQITVDKMEKTMWSDGSLGCPKEGRFYTQAAVPGYRVVFNYNQTRFEYHTGEGSQFISCNKQESSAGKFCGGIAGIECSTGYTCKLDGNYPDAGGKCLKEP